mmetsp:Transcript_47780/g.79086  ORF Transcript_47780/g.79086 Transcript_47780/m.79086 type:complete len:216 (-) Transcript_47780:19-666(-)
MFVTRKENKQSPVSLLPSFTVTLSSHPPASTRNLLLRLRRIERVLPSSRLEPVLLNCSVTSGQSLLNLLFRRLRMFRFWRRREARERELDVLEEATVVRLLGGGSLYASGSSPQIVSARNLLFRRRRVFLVRDPSSRRFPESSTSEVFETSVSLSCNWTNPQFSSDLNRLFRRHRVPRCLPTCKSRWPADELRSTETSCSGGGGSSSDISNSVKL